MDHFTYQNGALFAEDVRVSDIVSKVGTPFYCYSTATIERHYKVLANALSGLPADMLRGKSQFKPSCDQNTSHPWGRADVVSDGELTRALTEPASAAKIVFRQTEDRGGTCYGARKRHFTN